MTNSIVITGVGIASPAGEGPKTLFDSMIAGDTHFDKSPTGGRSSRPWAMATVDPSVTPWPIGPMWDKTKKYANTAAQAAVFTAMQAVDVAGAATAEEADRCGTVMAVSSSGADDLGDIIPQLAAMALTDPRSLAKLLYDEVPDYSYIRGIPSQLGQFVSMANGFRGSNVAVYGEAGANGLGALALGCRLIDSGELDRVMVVGVAPAMSVTSLVALDRQDSLARTADIGRGPFDAGRSGALLGQGAAAIVLESEHVAVARGIAPLAVLRGCESFAATDREVALDHAVRAVLSAPGSAPQAWWAHASGSVAVDQQEWQVVRRHLRVPATSSKGTMGNALECGGLIDIAMAVEALARKTVPQVGLLAQPDTALDGLDAVCGAPRSIPDLDAVLVTSLNHGKSAATAGAAVIAKGATP